MPDKQYLVQALLGLRSVLPNCSKVKPAIASNLLRSLRNEEKPLLLVVGVDFVESPVLVEQGLREAIRNYSVL